VRQSTQSKGEIMGRGDRKTKKGKIFAGSNGNSRLKKKNLIKKKAAAKKK
jgi:ribosomal small subunit protein bTHX